jgi:hypothetical protein
MAGAGQRLWSIIEVYKWKSSSILASIFYQSRKISSSSFFLTPDSVVWENKKRTLFDTVG